MARVIPRQVGDAAIEATARIVESWGYWRKITDEEIEHGLWFEDVSASERGVIWLMEAPGDEDGMVLHGCASPAARQNPALSDEVLSIVRVLVALVNAQRIYAPIPRTCDLSDALARRFLALERYLLRRGWRTPRAGLEWLGPWLEIGG